MAPRRLADLCETIKEGKSKTLKDTRRDDVHFDIQGNLLVSSVSSGGAATERLDSTRVRNRAVRMIAGNRFSKQLQGRFHGWVRGDVIVQNAPRPHFHNQEHIESPELSSHHDEKVACHDRVSMIAHKSPPVLRGSMAWTSPRFVKPIPCYGDFPIVFE